jgi:hypothetical protein
VDQVTPFPYKNGANNASTLLVPSDETGDYVVGAEAGTAITTPSPIILFSDNVNGAVINAQANYAAGLLPHVTLSLTTGNGIFTSPDMTRF